MSAETVLIDWIRARARVDTEAHIAEKDRRMPRLGLIFARPRDDASGSRLGAVAFGLLLTAVAVPALGTSVAHADFRVCNGTQNLVGVAIGYRAKAGWVSEGWWHIPASNCKTLIEGPLSSRYFYLYAEDAERGGRWAGPINMCVAEKEFKINGVNDCFARGFQRAGFQEYDTREQASWMVQLTDEPASDATPVTGTGGR